MLNRIGPTEMALILIALLIIFGPAKLPLLGKSVGETIREFRHSLRAAKEDEPAEPTEQKEHKG